MTLLCVSESRPHFDTSAEQTRLHLSSMTSPPPNGTSLDTRSTKHFRDYSTHAPKLRHPSSHHYFPAHWFVKRFVYLKPHETVCSLVTPAVQSNVSHTNLFILTNQIVMVWAHPFSIACVLNKVFYSACVYLCTHNSHTHNFVVN